MASNRFGSFFSFTSFGESHGKGIGVVIDGCPSNLSIDLDLIRCDLALRKPGRNWTSPRNESDEFEVLSGLYQGKTTGAPLAFFVKNTDHQSSSYDPVNHLFRPGHANFTYFHKYENFDPFGGGRSSARETIARVIAGSIAKQFLKIYEIDLLAYLFQIGDLQNDHPPCSFDLNLKNRRNSSSFFALEKDEEILNLMKSLEHEGESIGSIVHLVTTNLPIGLGDPIYEKLEALIASAMLSIPGTKGVEFGSGFASACMKGSQHHDLFIKSDDKIAIKTNHSGGILGGISNGNPLNFKVCFKPTSSIKKPIETVDFEGTPSILNLGTKARHDPCIGIRGVIVVEAMAAIVLADRILSNRLTKI